MPVELSCDELCSLFPTLSKARAPSMCHGYVRPTRCIVANDSWGIIFFKML